ncbi:MAG: porin family protein [Bacteroidales bacterium]
MKKIIIFTLAALFTSLSLITNAQEEQGTDKEFKPFRFGLHASPSISWIKPDTDGYEIDGTRIGFGYGILAEFNLTNNYALSTGVDIVYQGGKLSYSDTIEYSGDREALATRTYKLQYLHIPAMLRMSTNEIGYITYFANVGLGTAIRINAVSDDILDDGDNTKKPDVDISDKISALKTSFIIGVGAEYSLAGDIALMGSLNFNNGFSDVLSGKNIDGTKENAIANYIELKVGLMF